MPEQLNRNEVSVLLSIIVVNWNTRDLLAQCLESIYANPPRGEFEIIVVDNGSEDGSVAMVRNQFPMVFLIENKHNSGFATANNQAIRCAHGQNVLLLNPDTVVMPDALDALIQFIENTPIAGAAGSMLLNPDGTLQHSCHPAPTLGRELWRLFHLDALHPLALYPMNRWPIDLPRAVDTVQGASIIVRREMVDEVGVFDDSFFMYSEEVDWCLRIRRAGWQIYWVPGSRVVHYGGQSTRQVATAMFLQLYRAKVQYFRKHYGKLYGLLYKVELLIASIVRIFLISFMWLLRPAQRHNHAVLAQRYGRLIVALPEI